LRYRDQNGAVDSSTYGLDSTTIALLVDEERLGSPTTPPHTPRVKQPAPPPPKSHTPLAPHALPTPPMHAPPTPTPPTPLVSTPLPPSRAAASRNRNRALGSLRSGLDSTTVALRPERSGGQLGSLGFDDHRADGRGGAAWAASGAAAYAACKTACDAVVAYAVSAACAAAAADTCAAVANVANAACAAVAKHRQRRLR